MKYYTPFLLLFLLLGCIGCNKQRPAEQTGALLEIPLYSAEPTVLTNLSDVAEKVEFCNLSSEVSFKKKIPNDVALTDSFVFILLDDGIYQFASNGDFVRVIGQRGKGRGEFKRLMPPLEVDADNQICYVADKGNQKIMGFNYDGTLNKEIPLQQLCVMNLVDSETFMLTPNFKDRFMLNTTLAKLINGKGEAIETIKSSFYPINKGNRKDSHYGAFYNPVWRHNDSVYTMEYGNDTIYKLVDKALIPDKVLTGTTYKPSLFHLFHSGMPDKVIVNSLFLRPNSAVCESDSFLMFRTKYADGRFFMIYNKQTGAIARTDHPDAEVHEKRKQRLSSYFIDDVLTGQNFESVYQSGNKIIGLISGYDLYDAKDEILEFVKANNHPQATTLTDVVSRCDLDDNPLLMIVTLK